MNRRKELDRMHDLHNRMFEKVAKAHPDDVDLEIITNFHRDVKDKSFYTGKGDFDQTLADMRWAAAQVVEVKGAVGALITKYGRLVNIHAAEELNDLGAESRDRVRSVLGSREDPILRGGSEKFDYQQVLMKSMERL